MIEGRIRVGGIPERKRVPVVESCVSRAADQVPLADDRGAVPGRAQQVHQGRLRAIEDVAVAQDAEDFTVGNIRVEGLQRISEGTVYNYLPVNIGDRLDQRHVQEAIRALFATGFFSDIEIRRDGATLVVVVRERPSIESFELVGNKDLKTEDLQKSLRGVGLATGKTFDRSVLEEVRGFLTDQYFSRGKYAVRIDPKVEEVPGNKVRIKIDVVEGKRARIRQINLVGNTAYDDEELQEAFELRTPNWLSWYRQDDRYSRESLQGDMEKLQSYYQDRGYANFEVESTQVAIAPEKDDIFITMNLREGGLYTVGEVKLAGTMKVPEADLKRLLMVRTGQTYSRKLITQTQELIAFRLGVEGYAFAKIDPVPQAHEDTKTIDLTFFVDAGSRAYVRRINFINTSAIDDEVLRREMRQMEGSYLSNALLERSKEPPAAPAIHREGGFRNEPRGGDARPRGRGFDGKEGMPGSSAAASAIPSRSRHAETAVSSTRTSWVRASASRSNSSRASIRSEALRIPTVHRPSDNGVAPIGLTYRTSRSTCRRHRILDDGQCQGTLGVRYPISSTRGLRSGSRPSARDSS